MAFHFNGFRATKPVVRTLGKDTRRYEVFFNYYAPLGKPKQYRWSRGINSLPAKERKPQAEAFAYEMWQALNAGWNPLIKKYPDFNTDRVRRVYTFAEALDYGLKEKERSLSRYSLYNYRGCVRYMKKAAGELGLSSVPITSIERRDIRTILSTAREIYQWSSKGRNKYLAILKSLLTVLVDEDMIKYNPAHQIKDEKTEETEGFTRLTPDEKDRIYRHLSERDPQFLEYLMFIYQDGVRPKELLLIEIRDINLQRREITIRPEVAKTNRERKIPITDDLLDILIRREVWTLSPKWYLFSHNFAPGERPFSTNSARNRWTKYVQKELGIDCKMYCLKHTGADDKIRAGMSLQMLQPVYGHKSAQMTEVYARAIRDKYKEQFIAGAPVFSAKVVPLKKAE